MRRPFSISTKNELDSPAYAELAHYLKVSSNFTILVGAGASVSSGGGTSATVAKEVLRDAGRPQPDEDDEGLFRAFNEYLSTLKGRARYDDLRRYFDSLFPNIGYVYLAKIVQWCFQHQTLHALLTTNFDYLIEVALAKWSDLLPGRDFNVHVLGHADEVLDTLKEDRRRLKIIKVYGDFYAKIMSFTPEETRELPESATSFLAAQIASPLLILGYSARDGLGRLLLADRTGAPVWWVTRTSPLQKSSASFPVETAEFLKARNGPANLDSRVFSGDHGDFDGFMQYLYWQMFGAAAAHEILDRYLPEVKAGRPNAEPFEGARRKLGVLVSALWPPGKKLPFNQACEVTAISAPQMNSLLTAVRDLMPEYDIVRDRDELVLSYRTMLHAEKLQRYPQDKSDIGQTAAMLVQSGSLVLIDGGTTTLEVARRLFARCRDEPDFAITVVTNSVEIARLVRAHNKRFTVWFIGGEVRPESIDTIGATAARELNRLITAIFKRAYADICFVGATGIALDQGFCVRTPLEKDIKTTMLQLSIQKVVVADLSKFANSFRDFNSFWPLSTDVVVITNESENPPRDFVDRVHLLYARRV